MSPLATGSQGSAHVARAGENMKERAHTGEKARALWNLQAENDENENEKRASAFCSLGPPLFRSATATAADAYVVNGQEDKNANAQDNGGANPDNNRL